MWRANNLGIMSRRVALIGVCAMVVAGAVCVWQRVRTPANLAPEPPAVQLEGLDPAVARAIQSAGAAVRQFPRSGGAWGKLGMVFLAHDLPAEANSSFVQAERLDPREPRWPYYQAISLSSGKPEWAIPKLRRAAELCGEACSALILRLAELLLHQGHLEDAEKQLRRVLTREPEDPLATLGLARISFAQNKTEEALAHARRVSADVHTRKASHQLLAQVYGRLGNQDEAIAASRQATRLPEDAPWPDPFAEEVARLATGKQARISRADQLLGRNRVGEAIALLQEIVRDYPDADWAWMLLGRAFLMNRDITRAERALLNAVQLAPNSVLIQYHLGIVALAKKDYTVAAACFRKAIQLQPDFALAHGDLGTCLFVQGDRAGAEDAFRTALRCKPDYPHAHAGLGELLAAEQRQSEAVAHLRRAVELNPDDTRTSKLLERIQAASIDSIPDKK